MNKRQNIILKISHHLFLMLLIFVVLAITGFYVVTSFKEIVIPTPFLVFCVGLLGGFVGLQRRLKQLPEEDLELLGRSWVYISLSPLVGGILAVLTYILFISELLSGELFPSFTVEQGTASEGPNILFKARGVTSTDYAKLIFWCFLAGFSERFVIDIVSQFESRATDSPQD